MNKVIRPILGFLSLLFFATGCDEFSAKTDYSRPSWLPGKIVEVVNSRSDCKLFAEAIKYSGWDSIIGRTGLFTLFCPNDEAVNAYLASKGKSKVTDLSRESWDAIIRYHLIQDGWSPEQLKHMTIVGSYRPEDITETDFLKNAIAFKRVTRYFNPVEDFYIYKDIYYANLFRMSTTPTNEVLKRAPGSYKYVPVFFKEYFDILGYSTSEYSYYFDRTFDDNSMYYAGAKVIEQPKPAENGFVYIVDKIVEPIPNLEQVLKGQNKTNTYFKSFLDLFYFLPRVQYNETATKLQSAYLEGKPYNLLFDVDFTSAYSSGIVGQSAIDIDNEQAAFAPKRGNFDYNMNYHPTMIAPTDAAFNELINKWVTSASGYEHYGSFTDVPDYVRQLISSAYVSRLPLYGKDIAAGFKNEAGDSVKLKPDDIILKTYCSNGFLIGINRPIVPRAFKSVLGPVILNPRFEVTALALNQSKLLDEVQRADRKYTLFALDNASVGMEGDSSMIIDITEYLSNGATLKRKTLSYYDRAYAPAKKTNWSTTKDPVIKNVMLNMISDQQIEDRANVEYLRTLGGNYIQVDNVNKTVQGTDASTYGFNGDSIIQNTFTEFRESVDKVVDNGQTFAVKALLNFKSNVPMWGVVKELGRSTSITNRFSGYLIKAGLADNSNLKFISSQEFFTVFVPSDAAIAKYEADNNTKLDTWPIDKLTSFLKYHFVRGPHIFTDGKQPSGQYETMRLDKNSTSQIALYSKLNIRTSPDKIEILDNAGSPYVSIVPNSTKSNIQTFNTITETISGQTTSYSYTTGVVHSIDQVLEYKE